MEGGPDERRGGLAVLHCADAAQFETQLVGASLDAPGLWLKFAKKGAAVTTLSRQEAIDVALCHGWIDGHVVAYDAAFFLVRFTPRRRRSLWSWVNRTRAEQLLAEGRVTPAGLAQIEAARADRRWEAAYPPSSIAEAPADLQIALDGNPRAAARFAALDRTRRYALILSIATARKAETRQRRIAAFLGAETVEEDGKRSVARVGALDRSATKGTPVRRKTVRRDND